MLTTLNHVSALPTHCSKVFTNVECSAVAVGLASRNFQSVLKIGTDAVSFAYSSDGRKRSQTQGFPQLLPSSIPLDVWESFGSEFEEGDTVGCGFLEDRREIFFTKNGQYIGM